MKIMLGLLEPTSGELRIDGVPLALVGCRAYREHVGAVMQEDQLLSGSIADNICCLDQNKYLPITSKRNTIFIKDEKYQINKFSDKKFLT